MQDFRDKVAVVTGGASGIGRAMVDRFAQAGMRIVIADVEPAALASAERELRDRGATVLGVKTDVANPADVEALAAKAVEAFGGVHVLCNNAGVSVGGPMWEHTLDDWQWVFGVNLWGVIYGIRTFVPIMLKQNQPAHVVSTASLAGLTSNAFLGVYNATKHAVVTLSETLAQELAMVGAPIKVSVLCPGFVSTKIADSGRNRPGTLADGSAKIQPAEFEQVIRAAIAGGLDPAVVGNLVFEAIRDEKFYILPHPELTKMRVRDRMEGILENRQPTAAPLPR
jgi:NAD(P)-dependent dehydrogenase (short-subunit alcohol dehydrogenase family)